MTASPLRILPNAYDAFRHPDQSQPLKYINSKGLMSETGEIYKFISDDERVVDFFDATLGTEFDDANREMYDAPASIEIYRNFLGWLFETFNVDETSFRKSIINKLQLSKGMKVLITGCGFGDDIAIIQDIVGDSGEIHAQDLSKSMVVSASNKFKQSNIKFSVSSALCLPYQSNYFDAVFHFGGINLFGDTKKAISEMDRVCKRRGTVLFGDEGVAPHLRGTQYAEVAITNNKLWATETPIALLPHNALNIELSYVLGNCFYIIKFTPSEGLPEMNIDVPHKGLRGGSARTRYFGQVDGLTPATKEALINEAKRRGISIHCLMEEAVKEILPPQKVR